MNDKKTQEDFGISDKFGERLRQLRKKLGLVQKDFGESLGVSLATITRLERGVFNPQGDFLAKLALTYNCDIRWLLTGEEQKAGREGEAVGKIVVRHPRIFNLLQAQRKDWTEIVESTMRSVEEAPLSQKLEAEKRVKEYRDGITYIDALLKVGEDPM
jgi:transcriptional regulator with XRE-family HTH domain